ncbi:MAG TPA: DegT/DnrJ/EryC1/StrS family aminotransferase, partial [Candidatus Dormibacteraeota bacterium]|nr:DegT/DnrJ/EryC1/StrS family aminotransferase [Candidatus Dormibacteraeota bacterium]
HLSCVAAGLGPGDEAIVSGMTFVSTPAAVRMTGATPVLCEISGTHDFNLDVQEVERLITPRTRAVIAVHCFGYPAPIERLRELCDERGLILIEDSAQAVGAHVGDDGQRTGTVGDLGCFSFFSKNQLPVGEGGMITTRHEDLGAKVRSLRSHAMTSVTWDRHRGHSDNYDVLDVGYNYRMDEPRAALAIARLDSLEQQIEARRELARQYRRKLAGIESIEFVWDDAAVERASHFAFPVVLRDRASRDAFRTRLRDLGVQTTAYPAIHRFTDYASEYGELSLPRLEAVADRHCVLPMSAHVSSRDVEIVVEAVREAAAELVGSAAA